MGDKRPKRAQRRPRGTKHAGEPTEPRPRQTVAPATPQALRHLDLTAAACALLAFAAYLATLSKTVSGGDSGELITVAYTLGVAHPPGYPLYTMAGKLFTLIPFETIAWRVNLLSAVCDSAAAFLLCRAVGRWTGSLWCGVLAAGAFALSPVVWPYAVTAEVFALNNLFVAGLLALSVDATLRPDLLRRMLVAGAFWFGLGLTNHHTLVFFGAPVLAYMVLLDMRQTLAPRFLARLAGAFALGLLPYAYLPIASLWQPPISWGNQLSVSGFLAHLLRQEYGTFQLAAGSAGASEAQLLPRLAILWERLASTTFWVIPMLLLGSVVAVVRRSPTRWLAAVWIAALGIYLVIFSALANLRLEPILLTLQERFWQQAVVIAAALGGVGLFEITRRIGSVGAALRVALAVGLPAAMFFVTLPTMDPRADQLLRDYAEAILQPVEPEAILLTSSDETTGSLRYLQVVEGERKDLRIIPTGLLNYGWYRRFAAKHLPEVTVPPVPVGSVSGEFTARAFLDANAARFPIYIMNKEPWLQTLEEAYSTWPVGLPFQVLPKGVTPELEPWVERAEASFDRFDAARAYAYPKDSWPRYVAEIYWKQYSRYGFRLAEGARGRADDPEVARLVVRVLEKLAARHPEPEASVFKNLGVAYQFLARTDPAALEPMARHWRRYLATGPATDPDREAIRGIVERVEGAMGGR